jgi:thioredoxin-related protein
MHFLNVLLIAVVINILNVPRWVDNLDDAKSLAKEEQKLIFLIFSGSDWCRGCILFDHEVINSAEFHQLAEDHLVLLKADFPRKRKNQLPPWQHSLNESLAAKFNPKGEFPKLILMGPNEEILFESGYGQGQKDRFLEQLRSNLDHE